MATQIELAYSIMKEAHKGQVRKFGEDQGKPYVVHPIRVYEALKAGRGVDDSVLAAALLHDVLEDCPEFTVDTLLDMGVEKSIVETVKLLTRWESALEPDGRDYLQYILRIKDDPAARAIKRADLEDNMKSLRPGSMLDKYKMARYILGER